MTSTRFTLAALFLVLIGSAGCGGKFQTLVVTPFTGAHPSFQQASLQVSTNVPDTETETVLLEAKLKSELASILQEVTGDSPPTPGVLQIEVRLTKLRRVGKWSRLLLGVFAGRAKAVADISFRDGTGQLLGSYSVTGTSHGIMDSGLSEMEVALEKLSKGVRKLVSENLQ